MKIFNASGEEILDVIVEDNSYRYRSIMSDDTLIIKFSAAEPISLPVGSYTEYQGVRYTLWYPESFKKHNSRNFEYTLVLHSWREALKLYLYKDLSAKPYRVKFPLVATPDVFIQLLVDVLNLHDSGWVKGSIISSNEKLISFNHENCYDALNRIAQEFDTEWEIINKTIHLRRVEKFKDDPLPLSYGKGNGFVSGVGRVNDGDRQPIGRMYVEGGERNIDFSKYGSNTLLLPKSASLLHNGKTYETDEDGMYIFRVGNNNKAEGSYDGSKFYPKRVGAVSSVEVIDEEQHFYDIIDLSIPESLNYKECRIAGEKATIIFQSGVLAGREFDIEQTDEELTGYIHEERRFKIVPAEHDGYVMPGGVFIPKPGDKYAIFNISMPTSYIRDDATMTGASWDMFKEAVEVFAREEEQKFTFTGQIDGIWSKSRWLEIGGKIVPGGHILFSDEQFLPDGAVIRITGVKDYVNKPHKPEITLSNASIPASLGSVIDDLETDEVVIEESKKEAIRFTKRRWRDTKETMSMLKKSLLNFSDSINPIAIQTMQLLVGDESLQFRFVNSKTTPVRVNHSVVFNKTNKTLSAAAGILQHMSIGITTVKNKHAASEYKYWDMAGYSSPALDASKAYYLYAKCSKTTSSGTFLLSETAIAMESVTGFYHLLVGILNSENQGERSFASLYGYTEITPGRVITNRIESEDGSSFFDLVNGVFGGKFRFVSGGSETDLSDWADGTAQDIQDVQAEIDQVQSNVNAVSTFVTNLNNYVDGAFKDGVIDSAEAKAIEKYINSVNEIMSKAEASYNKVYANTYLEGTAKTNLLNAKINLWGQRDTLLSVINTAISGGMTTPAQKTAVDNAFNSFNSLMSAFQNALEEANKAIQAKLDNIAKGYVDGLQIGGRNLFSVNNFVADNKARGYSTIEVIQHEGNIAYRSTNIVNNHNVPRYLRGKFEANTQYYLQFKINWESYTDSGAQYIFRVVYTDGTASLVYANTSHTYRTLLTSANKTIDYISTTRQYDGTVVIYEAQIEKANKPSDWTPAIEDVQKNIDDVDTKAAEALAKANISKAITDKFGTDIDGGLITTVMMLLREVNSQINTAGFSGIQGALLDQPSYWSGGTHIQAQAFVPFVKKLENEQSTSLAEYNNLPSIVFLHSGAAKVGHFIVLTSGEILVIDPATGSVKLKFTTADLPAIADLVSGTNSQGSTAVGAGVASISSSQVVSGSTQVSKNGAIATFDGTHISLSARGVVQAGGMASFAEAVLYARQNGVRVQRLASVTIQFTNTVYEDKSAEVLPVPFSFPLDAGTYTFELAVHTTGIVSSGNAVTSASNLSWKHTVAGVKKQQYSKDGMMFFYSNRHFYFNELTGLDVKESDSSKFNMPGVLLSATIGASGGWSNVWGAKQSSTPPPAPSPTGRYTIYHTIGHTKYQVNCVSHTENRSFRVYAKNANSVVVECRTIGSSPTLSNAMFDITLTGNNY